MEVNKTMDQGPSYNIENLYDLVKERVIGDSENEEGFPDINEFENILNELIEYRFIIRKLHNEESYIYMARTGLKISEFSHIEDIIKQYTLQTFVENLTTFFILLNTQKGKMRQLSLEIKKWIEYTDNKVIPFIVVDNDTTLADQSADGIIRVIGELNVTLFTLSSNSKVSYKEIKTYIDAFEFDIDYIPPVIVLLANNKQIEKMLQLIHHINNKIVTRGSRLRYACAWDEADKTYPPFRNKTFNISNNPISVLTYMVNNIEGLHKLGFVTATDGSLLDSDYPECANAQLHAVVIDPEDEVNYRALHHEEAIVHSTPLKYKQKNNSYANEIINNNIEHFKTPIILNSGENYYRKIIINSNTKTSEMNDIAINCISNDFYAMTFNGYGGASIKVYNRNNRIKKYKTKGKKFNEVLFYIYKKLNLNDKPLVIIGRRKVDRGLGFHYSPKYDVEHTINYEDFEEGPLVTRGREGLIWTDMILSKIDDKNSAVQKAGRLAGIIGNSPQYHGHIDFWTDEHTAHIISRHNSIVDATNTYQGLTISQAVKYASRERDIRIPVRKINHNVDINKFLVYNDENTVKIVCNILGYNYKQRRVNEDGFIYTSISELSKKCELLEAIKAVPIGYGGASKSSQYIKVKKGPRKDEVGKIVNEVNTNEYLISFNGEFECFQKDEFKWIVFKVYYPCYKNLNDPTSIHYVIIIRPDDEEKVSTIKEQYPSIEIPQEGDF